MAQRCVTLFRYSQMKHDDKIERDVCGGKKTQMLPLLVPLPLKAALRHTFIEVLGWPITGQSVATVAVQWATSIGLFG